MAVIRRLRGLDTRWREGNDVATGTKSDANAGKTRSGPACEACRTGAAVFKYAAPGSERTWLLCHACAAAVKDRDGAAFAKRWSSGRPDDQQAEYAGRLMYNALTARWGDTSWEPL